MMYIRHFITAILVATPLAVSAVGQLGFAIGNSNLDGSCKTQSDFEADFSAIQSKSPSTLVRTYSSGDQYGNACNTPSLILSAAKNYGIKVLLGMWPDGGAYQKEKASLVSANLDQYSDTVYGIIVGSEGMYRGSYNEQELLGWLSDMQQTFPNILIGTADSWSGWANGTMDGIIKSGIKLALANNFAYWQYQDISNATKTYFDGLAQALAQIQTVSGSLDSIHFMNGETGWPSDGGSNAGPAIASTANAAMYWKSAICGLLKWDIDLFWFEAFDEPNKADAVGDNGHSANEKHWGSFNSDRSAKFDMSC